MSIKVIKATVTTTVSDDELTCVAEPFFEKCPVLVPFMLKLDEAVNLASGGTSGVAVDDLEYTVPLYDRRGYTVHADQVYREVLNRSCRVKPCAHGQLPCDLDECAHFRVMLAMDPVRLVVLDCLPRSTFVDSLESVADEPTTE